MPFTEKEIAAAHHEGAVYIDRTMPLYVALRRFTNHLEQEYNNFLEMAEYLQAKGLMVDLKERMESECTGDDFEKFEEVAERHYEALIAESEKLIPPNPEDDDVIVLDESMIVHPETA